ncbi:MAG: glycosyltransferase family 39 protein [Planctomycetaceae bacterium]|nr:glycosyltransferase family 39 protein [Planctomycetaceae bacterium]
MKHLFSNPWKLFFLAVAIRLIVAICLNQYLANDAQRDYLIAGDADGYWQLAQKMVAGEAFSLYEPARQVMRMPGFSAVLAISISLFGDSQAVARLLLAVLASLAVFPAFWMAARYHSREAGVIAGLIVAMLPVYVGFSVLILSESLFATCILFNMWAFSRWLDASQRSEAFLWAAASGLLAVFAVYIRPSWLLFPPFLVFALLIFSKSFGQKRLLESVVMLVCLVGPLLPWGIRNQQVTGHFVLTTLWMGPSLYDGLHPGATGASDMTFFEQDRVLNRMSEYEMNRFYKDQAVEFARQNPGRAFELGMIKLWRYWKPWPNADQFQNPALVAVVALGFLLLVGWAVCGGCLLYENLELLFLCTLPIVYFSALHMLFVSSLRYRLPAEYPLAVLAAIGLVDWYRRKKLKESSAHSN